MAKPRRHQAMNGTYTASGNSGTLANLGQDNNPTVVAFLDVQGPVSGTSPSLTITIYGFADGGRKAQLGQFTAVTASLSGPQRLVIHDVMEDNIEVDWAISGTTPSFGGVTCDLFFSSPDA
jgi:hypothetical protein